MLYMSVTYNGLLWMRQLKTSTILPPYHWLSKLVTGTLRSISYQYPFRQFQPWLFKGWQTIFLAQSQATPLFLKVSQHSPYTHTSLLEKASQTRLSSENQSFSDNSKNNNFDGIIQPLNNWGQDIERQYQVNFNIKRNNTTFDFISCISLQVR